MMNGPVASVVSILLTVSAATVIQYAASNSVSVDNSGTVAPADDLSPS